MWPAPSISLALIATELLIPVHGIPSCPYPGAVFPKPTDLASSDIIQTALTNLTATFNARGTDPANNPNATSWSIQVFSASSDEPIWEHYHTAMNLLSADNPGVKSVDGDTIYRLGSLTKIFTIVTFLAEVGDAYWNTPVTRYVPELDLLAGKAQYDPVMNVAWDEITLGNLASHMAGIVRDYALEGELTQENNQTVLIAQGFPPAPQNMTPICGEAILCNRAQFFTGLANVPPSFAPGQTAGYSNIGYQLLAYALEGITQRDFLQMLEADVIAALGLANTHYRKPADELGVIPPSGRDSWAHDLGEASPTGNMYASVSDLSALGRAIFRSALMPPAQTRRWLKPASLTAEMHEGLSYPWGVRRIPVETSGNNSNRVVDAYSKAGSIGAYASLMVLLPDYEVGFAALLAGGWPGNANWDMADAAGAVLVPALEAAARAQAAAAYAGLYSSPVEGLNSSLALSTEAGRPGLGVDRWLSNGTDMVAVAVRHTLNYDVALPSVRLYPTGLETMAASGEDGGGTGTGTTRRVAFKALVEDLGVQDRSDRMFSTNCGTWVSQTTVVYADMPLDQFVFTLNAEGDVISVEPLALRASLMKVS
ncbi:beta-lactamase/transpeptidase-like protein [Biscogniauxia sp. FL1348]|nr:beta-lactamase/transpeptidase-like protein [Biscogniauxia sp. FL1348]